MKKEKVYPCDKCKKIMFGIIVELCDECKKKESDTPIDS